MDTFGVWLQGQRNERKLTRQEFADRLGCSVAMLRKIEADERRPSVQIAELIANCLNIPPIERETFVRVARGELAMARLNSISASKREPGQGVSLLRINLPALPTPLIGRQHEVNELNNLLRDSQCRMLTLVGPGGIGKTRLAIETASQVQSLFADGVYFVSFASINSSRSIAPLIADSMGFTFQGESSVITQLLNYLAEKQVLLLADNLEHLLSDMAVTDLFTKLLGRATQVKLLVTSRESLGLQGEWVFEVHGLAIPERTDIEGTSVELFLQRARRAHVSFDATTEEFPAIIQICRLVNGMPLGIELAAAWVRTLSCEEIANEIERGLDFLSLSAKDLPARHRSLRAVFDHSWKLLTDKEQNVLLRLSSFQGGFSREAAQQVAGASLPMLSTLVTKSLVRRSATGRYDLHELVRQYAFEQLARQPDVLEDVQTHHGRYYMMFLSGEDTRLRGAEQRASIAGLTADIDNIRSAQEWALACGEFELIEKTLRPYSTYYDALGWLSEGLDYLARVRDGLEKRVHLSRAEQVALAHVLACRSLFALRAAQIEQAGSMLDRSLDILRHLNEPRVLVEVLNYLGSVQFMLGDLAGAAKLLEEGLQIASDIGDQWYAALCLTELTGIHMMIGEANNIYEQFHAAVEAWRRTGDPRFIAFGLSSLSMSAIESGKYAEAQAALEESIAINSSTGDRWGLGNAYHGLGLAALAQAQHPRAIALFRHSLEIYTELGAHWEEARLLSDMGRSMIALGQDIEAKDVWCKSLRLAQETHAVPVAMESIFGIASVHAKRGDHVYAFQLLLIIINHVANTRKIKARAGQAVSELKKKLTPEEVESARTFATAITFETVVNEILRQEKERPGTK
jgi:predicted ATPase/transcriptional regulator with XRE-family HTH domain